IYVQINDVRKEQGKAQEVVDLEGSTSKGNDQRIANMEGQVVHDTASEEKVVETQQNDIILPASNRVTASETRIMRIEYGQSTTSRVANDDPNLNDETLGQNNVDHNDQDDTSSLGSVFVDATQMNDEEAISTEENVQANEELIHDRVQKNMKFLQNSWANMTENAEVEA
ncbi:hypothetical protein A2U01_0043805, partial [Trifolium medium]|nr:hypothetical protein [Trifolium medium]